MWQMALRMGLGMPSLGSSHVGASFSPHNADRQPRGGQCVATWSRSKSHSRQGREWLEDGKGDDMATMLPMSVLMLTFARTELTQRSHHTQPVHPATI